MAVIFGERLRKRNKRGAIVCRYAWGETEKKKQSLFDF